MGQSFSLHQNWKASKADNGFKLSIQSLEAILTSIRKQGCLISKSKTSRPWGKITSNTGKWRGYNDWFCAMCGNFANKLSWTIVLPPYLAASIECSPCPFGGHHLLLYLEVLLQWENKSQVTEYLILENRDLVLISWGDDRPYGKYLSRTSAAEKELLTVTGYSRKWFCNISTYNEQNLQSLVRYVSH